MSGPWWSREAGSRRRAELVPGDDTPRLVPATPRRPLADLRRRIVGFTPDWTRLDETDAGVALVRLFGSQLKPLLDRLNRLPRKMLVEALRISGVERLPGSAARVLVALTGSDAAPRSVFVAAGFQIGGPPADGSNDLVIFETERDLHVAPGEIAELHVQEGRNVRSLDGATDGEPFAPFGDRPIAGRALLVGIEAPVAPTTALTLGIGIASPPGAPPPFAAGGLAATPPPARPILDWEVFDGGAFRGVEVRYDGTADLGRSGVVEIELPRRWRAGRPAGAEGEDDLFWLRLRLLHGAFDEPPVFSLLRLNMVPAMAAITVRDEVLEHVADRERTMRLARTPVLPGTLRLDVVEGGGGGDLFDLDDDGAVVGGDGGDAGDGASETTGDGVRRWREISDLGLAAPSDRVYLLDETSGEVTFGDGVHGAALPPGFRHVRAASYKVGGGRAGAVDAEALSTLVHSAPFVVAVVNPLPASGGGEAEPLERSLRRGPREIRARGRAVTAADYELMALSAQGAEVARVHAVGGLHPALGGGPLPGVVGVFVVPPDRGEGPPTADAGTLEAVATHLVHRVAPAGVEVVAAAVRYHRVRAELSLRLRDPSADAGDAIRRALAEIDRYLHPLTGGDDGEGWPFGAPIRHRPLLRRLLTRVDGLSAIPRLNLVVDGVRLAACADAPISAHGLPWPDGHEAVLERDGGTP